MKKLVLLFSLAFTGMVSAQETQIVQAPASEAKTQIVEASCGQCQFGMHGKGCALAVRIDGKSYFVDGASIDDYGDADGEHGFCEVIRKAEVTGEIVGDRFKATSFKLLPVKAK